MAEPIKITLGSLDGSIKTVKVMNKLAASAVTSVAGRIGDVVLSQYDVGLGNLNNTSDLNKPISTATQAAIDAINVSGDYAPLIHQHIASDITDLADGPIAFTNKTLTDPSNVIHADQLHFSVRAVGGDINRGQAVRYDSYQLGQDVINARLSDHLTHISIGLAEENIANNSVGKIITAGVIDNIDTSDYDEGEYVYVSQNGNLTKDEALAGFDQPIAFCLKKNPSNGALQVLSAYPKQPSTDVRNDSTVSGLNVTEALESLQARVVALEALLP